MVGYIYRITNKITGQHYIGQTIDINRRRRTHFSKLRNNSHDNPKLQASWNKYGESNFEFESWEFNINSEEELNKLECEYMDKYSALELGFNLTEGGSKPPSRQKVKDEDIITFLCVLNLLGDGYGKTCEQIFGWAKGTASTIKRRVRYINAINIYEKLSEEEKIERGKDFIESQHLREQALQRQLTQGGCLKSYSLTQDDYNFAFCAKEIGFRVKDIANYFGVKECTVYDWINHRSRQKEYLLYLNLNESEKEQLVGRVKTAELSGKPKSVSSN